MPRPLACAVCIAILTFGALAPGGAQPSAQRGGVMPVATNADPPGLDLMWQTSAISLNISQHVFETLLTLDAQKRIAPELAESYAVSNGGKTFTFKLRPRAGPPGAG
jgi:peptide/nickel transport system substrate-binding protein